MSKKIKKSRGIISYFLLTMLFTSTLSSSVSASSLLSVKEKDVLFTETVEDIEVPNAFSGNSEKQVIDLSTYGYNTSAAKTSSLNKSVQIENDEVPLFGGNLSLTASELYNSTSLEQKQNTYQQFAESMGNLTQTLTELQYGNGVSTASQQTYLSNMENQIKLLENTKNSLFSAYSETSQSYSLNSEDLMSRYNETFQNKKQQMNTDGTSLLASIDLSSTLSSSEIRRQEELAAEEYFNSLKAKVASVNTSSQNKLSTASNNDSNSQSTSKTVTISNTGTNLVYDPNNLLVKSNVTVEQMKKALKGTSLENAASSYVEAEQVTGINAFYLAALSAHESNWGNSNIAKTKNNITGFQAYNHNTSAAKVFESYSDCMLYTANYLKENYLTAGGKYYNGVSIRAVNTRYCLDDYGNASYSWSTGISKIANTLLEKASK